MIVVNFFLNNDLIARWWDSEVTLLSPGYRDYVNSRRKKNEADFKMRENTETFAQMLKERGA